MTVRSVTSLLSVVALAGCGGGGGGGGSAPPGPPPANSQTLAQLSAVQTTDGRYSTANNTGGQFSSSRNSGGYGKSIRYRQPTASEPATLARITSDSRSFQGILFTDQSDTGEVNGFINGDRTIDPVQLVNNTYVTSNFPNGTLELSTFDLGVHDSVLAGMWRYTPPGTNPQTFNGGWHAGSLTDVADLPTGSSVIFTGTVVGTYVRDDNTSPSGQQPLVVSRVTGNASLEMNFVTGDVVEGANSALFNLALTDLPGETLNSLTILNDTATAINGNTFDARLQAVNSTGDSTDFSPASTGDISGRFYGPGGADQELGSAFRMRENSEREIFSGVFTASR